MTTKKRKASFRLPPAEQARIDAIYNKKMELFKLYNKPLKKRKITGDWGMPIHYIHQPKNKNYIPRADGIV